MTLHNPEYVSEIYVPVRNDIPDINFLWFGIVYSIISLPHRKGTYDLIIFLYSISRGPVILEQVQTRYVTYRSQHFKSARFTYCRLWFFVYVLRVHYLPYKERCWHKDHSEYIIYLQHRVSSFPVCRCVHRRYPGKVFTRSTRYVLRSTFWHTYSGGYFNNASIKCKRSCLTTAADPLHVPFQYVTSYYVHLTVYNVNCRTRHVRL